MSLCEPPQRAWRMQLSPLLRAGVATARARLPLWRAGGVRPGAGRLIAFAAIVFWLAGCVGYGQDAPEDIAGLEAIRGSVVKVMGDTFVVKTAQGATYRVMTSVNTRFVADGQESRSSAIHAGQLVLAGGELDEKQHTLGAVFLAAVDAEQLAEFDRRRAEFGKTWLAGTIVSIHGAQLVIKRPDDVVTTVTVDENTSFRRRHESITLGEIQVGDGLTARGAMQKGAFAGTLLTVVDAREIREWSKLRDR